VTSAQRTAPRGRRTRTARPADVAICPNPVFVIGAPRSGTTVVARALAQHEDFWSGDESQVLVDLFGDGELRRNYERLSRPDGSWLHKQGIEREEFLGYVGLGLNALFTSASRGKRWVDHTPSHALLAETIAEMFPGAFFLHVLRDGRRVVHSMVHFLQQSRWAHAERGVREPWMSDFRSACRVWRRYVEASAAFAGTAPDRCLTVVNDEVLRDPDEIFTTILAFLQADHDPRPAEYLSTHRVNSSFMADSAERASVEELLGPNPWDSWSAEQRRIFVEETGEALVACGLATEQELSA
jgi:sulfotransferase family protein